MVLRLIAIVALLWLGVGFIRRLGRPSRNETRSSGAC